MDHELMMQHFNSSWTELADGGGGNYMKPRCAMPYLGLGTYEGSSGSHKDSADVERKGIDESIQSRRLRRIDHRRMTLDQYYYSVLTDTDTRDLDQVLSKFIGSDNKQTARTDNRFHDLTLGGQERRMLMVDQLWFWVVDEKTFITATTEKEPDNLLVETIKRNLTGGETRSRFAQPRSIHMFIEQVLGITTGFSEWPIVGLETSLDVFRESIRKVVGAVHRNGDIILHILKSYQANAEAELFKVFRDALEAERGQQHDSPRRSGHAVKAIPSNPYHIISPETTLLEKIRDI
ncbi:hypothetical protein FNYG_11638 [Fusarium nygamai]|uniref:Uncharacterized protein n=1 Tax=Gibberella nygamai TaxID=42673 RepID=A0A2K0VY92_GIBNY|nr:hypothetical protein FNYG_11638 [Fusarium nygamai]